MSPNQPPAYLRYLKARLKPFKRPAFWTSAIALLLVLLFAWEYWNNPKWFNSIADNLGGNSVADSNDNQTTEAQLSSQELAAIGADIDSSSVLLTELGRNKPSPLAPLPNQKSHTSNVEELLAQLNPQQADAESKRGRTSSTLLGTPSATLQPRPIDSNPFALSAQQLLDNGPLGGNSLYNKQGDSRKPFSSLTGFADDPVSNFKSLNSLNTNRGVASVSPLSNTWNRDTLNSSGTANTIQPTTNGIQQPVNPPLPALSAPIYRGQSNYSPTTMPGATGDNTSPITPTVSSNSYTSTTPSLSPTQPITGMPGAAPVTPVAPVTSSSFGQYPTQPSSQISGVPNPGFSSTQINPAGLQPSQLSRPDFTVPGAMQRPTVGGESSGTVSNP